MIVNPKGSVVFSHGLIQELTVNTPFIHSAFLGILRQKSFQLTSLF